MNKNRIRICGRNTTTLPTPGDDAVLEEAAQQAVGQRIVDERAERCRSRTK